ncbi:MAG: DUF2203 domain-containing protein [Acidobacteriaceae bacterium]|jgi:hypothetical protein|nr:DUF2203 domain-containing protein [Acidobacteriaceae bacterium]
MRTFTLSEAQTLLPVLESLLRRAIAANAKAVTLEDEMQRLNQRIFLSGGMNVDVPHVARRRGERHIAIREAKDTLNEIDSIGVQVKDLDTGLLDFPCKMDGQVVLLCWRLGEKSIDFWHTTDTGFASRQPLDERFKGDKPQ